MKKIISLIALTAMLAVPVFAQTSANVRVNSLNALVQLPILSTNMSAMVSGNATIGDGGFAGDFTYDSTSSAATNTYSVFKPAATTGRWIRRNEAAWNQFTATTASDSATYAFSMRRNLQTNVFNLGADNNNAYLQSQASYALHLNNQGNTTVLNSTAGSVGIGADSPASLLEVRGGLTTAGSILTLGTKEPSVVVNDVLGRINFYAPLDAAGTDANLVAGSIVSIAEGTFSTTSNASSLLFQTGSSEIATTKMTITSGGNVTVTGAITSTAGNVTATNGSLLLGTAGNGLQIKEGSNARMGTSTLSGGTIAISNTSAVTGDRIFITRVSGTAAEFGHLSYTISTGVSFTVNSTDAQDDSVINWLIIKPTP